MSSKRFGATVKRLREGRSLTQQDLAKRARVSQPYLSQLEAGEKENPAMKIVQRLAKALGVQVTELLE